MHVIEREVACCHAREMLYNWENAAPSGFFCLNRKDAAPTAFFCNRMHWQTNGLIGHGCFGNRMLLEHERYYGLGEDALEHQAWVLW